MAILASMSALPVLWLYGPSGVGKSTAAWELSTRLWGDGVRAAYVDIDQIGMCYGPPTPENWAPEPADDPVRHRLKTLNLDAVAANARDAGAACLVVSGIVDPEHGIDRGLLPNVALTPIRLRADEDELRHRLALRARPDEPLDEILRDAATLERFPGEFVDTTGRGVDAVVERVLKLVDGWPRARTPEENAATRVSRVPGTMHWICGPREDGKSTVAWQVYRELRRSGTRADYLDLEQVGFLAPPRDADPGNRRLMSANLASVWRTFRDRGAECLVVAAPDDNPAAARSACAAALPDVNLVFRCMHGR